MSQLSNTNKKLLDSNKNLPFSLWYWLHIADRPAYICNINLLLLLCGRFELRAQFDLLRADVDGIQAIEDRVERVRGLTVGEP